MGEYKLVIRFDAKPRLTEEERIRIRECIREVLDLQPKVEVICVKLLNVTD